MQAVKQTSCIPFTPCTPCGPCAGVLEDEDLEDVELSTGLQLGGGPPRPSALPSSAAGGSNPTPRPTANSSGGGGRPPLPPTPTTAAPRAPSPSPAPRGAPPATGRGPSASHLAMAAALGFDSGSGLDCSDSFGGGGSGDSLFMPDDSRYPNADGSSFTSQGSGRGKPGRRVRAYNIIFYCAVVREELLPLFAEAANKSASCRWNIWYTASRCSACAGVISAPCSMGPSKLSACKQS